MTLYDFAEQIWGEIDFHYLSASYTMSSSDYE